MVLAKERENDKEVQAGCREKPYLSERYVLHSTLALSLCLRI